MLQSTDVSKDTQIPRPGDSPAATQSLCSSPLITPHLTERYPALLATWAAPQQSFCLPALSNSSFFEYCSRGCTLRYSCITWNNPWTKQIYICYTESKNWPSMMKFSVFCYTFRGSSPFILKKKVILQHKTGFFFFKYKSTYKQSWKSYF